jgi:hypothetical protein
MVTFLLTFYTINYIKCSSINEFNSNNDVFNECDSRPYETLTNNFNIPTSNDDLEEYLRFLNNIIEPSCRTNGPKNNCNTDPHEKHLNVNFYNYIEEVYHVIKYNIYNFTSEKYFKPYIKRLNLIKETLMVPRENQKYDEEIFSPDYDVDFLVIVDYLKLKYSHFINIDHKLYDNFSFDLDQKIREIQDRNHVKYKILQKNIKNEFNLHLKEFMKIYKYIKVFPELLCLGYASTQSCLKKASIIFHLLRIFLSSNESNLIEYRQIVMLLLKKTFSHSLRHNLDFIYILQFQQFNVGDRSNLFFFCCEFNHLYRKKIKHRIIYHKDPSLFFIEEDRIHYNIVLNLFLFQHLIYLRYKNAKNTEFEEFKEFINVILWENGCYKTQFDRFIKMI